MISPPHCGRGHQRLGRREAEILDEELEIARVAADRRVREAVIAAGQHAHAAAHQFGHERTLKRQDLVAALHQRFGQVERRIGMDCAMRKTNSRRDENFGLLRLEHVERFGVGVAAMVEHAEAVFEAELHRRGGLRVTGEPDVLASCACIARGRDLVFVIGELLRAVGREIVVARQQQLDRIQPELGAALDVGAHRRGTAPMPVVMGLRNAEDLARRALDRRGFEARPRQPAAVDLVAQRDLETRAERAGGIGAGKAVIERDPRVARGDQQMLFRRDGLLEDDPS